MGNNVSEKFVRGLREKIEIEKDENLLKLNLTSDGFDYISSFFKSNSSDFFYIKKIVDFPTKDLCFFLDVFSSVDIPEILKHFFSSSDVPFSFETVSDDITVFRVDLEKKIKSSGNPHNFFFIETYKEKNFLYKIKFFLKPEGVEHSIYKKNHNSVHFWVFDGSFKKYDIDLNEIKKREKIQKIKTADNKFRLKIYNNDFGEFLKMSISKIGRNLKIDL